jgi:dTDP-4-dehydrorhamnose 3,5-epimerase
VSFLKNKQESTRIKGLSTAELCPFEDNRGHIWTLFDQNDWHTGFVEDKLSISSKNVLRGLHGDKTTDKLISCLAGSFFLAVVDARLQSPTYGNIEVFVVDDKNPKLIFVPAGCLNGHLCLTKQCIFWYKWSEHYKDPENQVTCKWNDEQLNIDWPCKEPILSKRDSSGIDFEKIKL